VARTTVSTGGHVSHRLAEAAYRGGDSCFAARSDKLRSVAGACARHQGDASHDGVGLRHLIVTRPCLSRLGWSTRLSAS
jgi:hypothetical protein